MGMVVYFGCPEWCNVINVHKSSQCEQKLQQAQSSGFALDAVDVQVLVLVTVVVKDETQHARVARVLKRLIFNPLGCTVWWN